MILTERQYHSEQPRETSSAPEQPPPTAFQGPLTIAGTNATTKSKSYPQGNGCTVSPTISAKSDKHKGHPDNSTLTESKHPLMPKLETPPRKVSTSEDVLATSNDYLSVNNRDDSHATIANGARKLFVGGLPTDITQPEFQTFFAQFGELKDAVVMFDRDTKCSRGFGFVTYIDPEVSKKLLRMGDRNDGIGRLEMRGKTCEVKAATPKGEGPYNPRKGPRGATGVANDTSNAYFRSSDHPLRSGHSNDAPAHPYSAHLSYPLAPNPLTGPHHHHHYPYANGYPSYGMAHTPYYPAMAPPNYFGMYPGMDPSAAYASAGSPPAMFSHYMAQHEHAMAPHYYPAHNHHQVYAPMMPTTAGMAMDGAAAAASMQTSVMQPVAPGIPGKEEEYDDNTSTEHYQE